MSPSQTTILPVFWLGWEVLKILTSDHLFIPILLSSFMLCLHQYIMLPRYLDTWRHFTECALPSQRFEIFPISCSEITPSQISIVFKFICSLVKVTETLSKVSICHGKCDSWKVSKFKGKRELSITWSSMLKCIVMQRDICVPPSPGKVGTRSRKPEHN